MFKVDRPKCPLCKTPTKVHHCRRANCDWFVCYKCPSLSEALADHITFDSRGRSFRMEKVK